MSKFSAQGSDFQCEIASVFTTLPNITKIEGPDSEQMYEDLTDLASTAVEDGELVGLGSPGTVKIEGFWDPQNTVHQLIMTSVLGTAGYKNFKIRDKVGSSQYAVTAFSGSFKTAPVTREGKKFTSFSAEIKVRTMPTHTPYTP